MTDLTAADIAPRRPSHWKKHLLRLAFFFVVVACVGMGAISYLRYVGDKELAAAVAAIDAAEPEGWRLEQLEARPLPPEGQNSAEVVQKAKALLPTPWPARTTTTTPSDKRPALTEAIGDVPRPAQLAARQVEDLHKELARAAAALAEARKLTDLPEGRLTITWASDFISTNISQIQDVREVLNLLRLDAALRAQEGDAAGALTSCRALLNGSRSIGDSPSLICQLVRFAGAGITVAALERTLAQTEPTDAALKETQELLQKEADYPALRAALRGERACNHATCLAFYRGDATLSSLGGGGTAMQNVGERLADRFAPSIFRSSHVWLLRWLTECIAAADLPPQEQGPRFKELEAAARSAPVLARLLVPSVLKVGEASWRSQAGLRCAVAAVAAERYRRAQGRWPTSLAELVPAYLPAVPVDPYDGQSLRFLRLPDGVLVYSVGPDLKDDGGKLNRKNLGATGTDLGFQLWDPARRRQPPVEEPADKKAEGAEKGKEKEKEKGKP